MSRYVGADGCRDGWVAVALEGAAFGPVVIYRSFAELVGDTADEALVLVDIPIGLLGAGGGQRGCDVAARRLLGRRASSVFTPPVRAAAHIPDYREASAVNFAAVGRRLSRQAWGIVPKIAAVDRLFSDRPLLQERVRETHPEACFAALSGGQPLRASKKTPQGLEERLALISRFVREPRGALVEARSRYSRSAVTDDDIVDAMAAALTARMAAEGGVHPLPPEPERDERGLRMEILVPLLPT
jgi:predicted RNase H-like nuclease